MKSPISRTPDDSRSRFRIGLIFLVLSYVFGWPFLLLIEALALYLENSLLGVIGAVIYSMSWVFLGIAVLLSGPGVVEFARSKLTQWKPLKSKKSPHE